MEKVTCSFCAGKNEDPNYKPQDIGAYVDHIKTCAAYRRGVDELRRRVRTNIGRTAHPNDREESWHESHRDPGHRRAGR